MSDAVQIPLEELQRRVAALVMQSLTVNETTRHRTAKATRTADEAEELIRPNDRLTSFERLEIYNRQYWFRLFSCLEEDFPGVKALLGSRTFQRLMRAYLQDCPSRSFTLRDLGSRLPQWLRANPSWAEPHQEVAVEIADLEWAHIEAFDSAAAPPVMPEDLIAIGPESRVSVQPFLQLLQANHAIDNALIALRNPDGTGGMTSGASTAQRSSSSKRLHDLSPERIYLIIHRFDDTVYYRRADEEDFQLLLALKAGATLEDAIDRAFEQSRMPEVDRPAHLESAFRYWVSMGWLCRI